MRVATPHATRPRIREFLRFVILVGLLTALFSPASQYSLCYDLGL